MKVTSNIAAVQARLGRIPAALNVAMDRALQDPAWLVEARETAERVLRQLATDEERHYVSGFVARVTQRFERGLRLRLTAPQSSAELAYQPTVFGDLEFVGDASRAREWIERWVATPYDEGGKKRDARDAGKSDDDIASLIAEIMLTGNPTDRQSEARKKLFPHIAEFIAAQMQEYRLAPATVTLWLRAVLEAWREMIRFKFPEKLRNEFRKAVAA